MAQRNRTDLPWVEKYRPRQLGDIVSHESALATIKKFIEADGLPHLLFYGPPGTGKTTTANAIARTLYPNGSTGQLLELNASDDRGIDIVRNTIKGFASNRAIFSTKHKLIILDESDAMTSAAQAALRRIMEKYTANVRFIMICNYPERLIPALRSRCSEFRFAPIPSASALIYLKHIAEAENLTLSDDGSQALIRLGTGDLRRSINLLQTTSLSTGSITESSVYQCAGYPLPEEISIQMESLLNQTLDEAYLSIEELRINRGHSLLDIVRELHRQVVLMEFPAIIMAKLIERLAIIERNISNGSNEAIQSAAIVSAFQLLRIEADK